MTERIADRWDTMGYPDRVQLLRVAGLSLCEIQRSAAVTANWCAVSPLVRRRIALRIENRVEV